MTRKRRSLIGGSGGLTSLVPDVSPVDDESSVRTEPFRSDTGTDDTGRLADLSDPGAEPATGGLSGDPSTAPTEVEEAAPPRPAEPAAADPAPVAAAADPAPAAEPPPPAADPAPAAEAPPPAEPPRVAPAAAPEVTSTPAPGTRAPSLSPAFEEKDDWFVGTGTPAASREAEPEVVVAAAPNPQIYVFALLVAVLFGVVMLGVVWLIFG